MMHNGKQQGMVLIITLIILSVVSLMLAYTLHAVELQKQLNHYQAEQMHLHQLAEEALQIAYKNFPQTKQNYQVNNVEINYTIDKLQHTPCVFFKQKPVDFWQITVRATQASGASQTLQADVAFPATDMVECEGKKQYLSTLWQSEHS